MTYRAIVFDLFHTLISIEQSEAPGPMTHEMIGVPNESLRETFYQNPAERYVRDDVDLVGLIVESAATAGVTLTRERAEEIERFRAGRFRHAMVYVEPSVIEGLEALRAAGCRIGLLSDVDQDECAAWNESPLRPFFDSARFSCHSGLQKPDPDYYRLILSDLGASPEETLYVGDGGSDELRGAAAVGLTPVLITRHLRIRRGDLIDERRPLAAHVVDSVGDILDIVAGSGTTDR